MDSRIPTARILVVEDQEDVRRLLVTALEMDGHRVDEAATAAEGLRCLEAARYSLVLSDYAMPGGTGTWMLHEASRRGLMDGTVALIVTAHPHVGDLFDCEVITKPLDLDHFLEQVRRLLGSPPPGDDGPGAPPADPEPEETPAPRLAPSRLELVLYISSISPASLQARRHMETLLASVDTASVKFTICDLSRDPLAGDADRVAFTPTLVRRFPEPKVWVLGSLKDAEVVADLLRASGIEPSR